VVINALAIIITQTTIAQFTISQHKESTIMRAAGKYIVLWSIQPNQWCGHGSDGRRHIPMLFLYKMRAAGKYIVVGSKSMVWTWYHSNPK